MNFIADKQTLDDLNLLGKYTPHSIYSIFNQVKTPGGERLLTSMFRHPVTDPGAINQRSGIFRYFQERKLLFPYKPESFRVVENYLSSGGPGNMPQSLFSVLYKKLSSSFLRDEAYPLLHNGLLAAIEALNSLKDLLAQLEDSPSNPYRDEAAKLRKIFTDRRLNWLEEMRGAKKIPVMKLARYNFLLLHTLRHEMEAVLNSIYQLDVYIAISRVAEENSFAYATALPASQHLIRAEELWHPALPKAVPNTVSLHQDANVLFLTGANMAGKSTLMKSFGIAVYLAHMGFPVAAKEMRFSVRDGLYSSINVPDNLNMGYSHFYAEVLRVKKAAEEVSGGKNMVVIFDELFKGTNVKDAYDATLSVTAAFAEYRNCFFVISTHIIEVGEDLRSYPNLQFAYLPTVMEGNIPVYTYLLTEGITSDRHGMMIVENEGIIELITGSPAAIHTNT